MQIQEYKCPNCAGTVKFDSSSQKMKCPFCDAEFEIAALEELQREQQGEGNDDFGWDASSAGTAWDDPENDDLATGACPSCGAEIFGDQNTIATVCPCCGNAQIVAKRLTGMLKPDFVIPFKLKKDAAVDELKKFCKGKKLLPSTYLEEKRISELQGVYVPFWLYDADAHGHVRYKATKTKTWSDSRYIYTRTDFYSVVRDGSAQFEKIPVDGSLKMDDQYMDAIEPFDYGQITGFNPSFLAGFLAEKYDVSADECKGRAGKRMKATIESEFRKSVSGYVLVTPESSKVDVKQGKVNYALFPVWVLNTKYRDENYQFMMNGQSGRLVGKLPVDNGKAWTFRGVISAVVGLLLSGAAYGLSLAQLPDMPSFFTMLAIAWALGLGSGFGIVQYWKYQMNSVRHKGLACEYMVSGSLKYKVKSDRFLYSTTKRIPIPRPTKK